MKNIFLSICLLYCFNLSAQTPYPSGSYNAKPELDKFVGTWRWVSGSDTVEIRLFKQAIHYPQPLNYDVEALVGWHKYVNNGVTIETSLQFTGLPRTGGHSTMLAWDQTPNKVYGTFTDLTKNKNCDIYLTMTNAAYTQLDWKLKEPRGIRPAGFQYGFTLPVNLTLTKQ